MAGISIGTLSGRIELEDKMSSVLDIVQSKIGELGKNMGGAAGRIAEGAASFTIAGLALQGLNLALEKAGQFVNDLVEGAGLQDIAENFDRLSANADHVGSVLLGRLREGLHGTVSDMEIMQSVNKNLAAGLNLSDTQFRALADGAFALAQATGTDVKDAFDKMNDAMLTGRTRGIQVLTGKIDLEKAEKAYAASLGLTREQLTDELKLESTRVALLESVAAATVRLGTQTDGLDEKIAQMSTAWQNSKDTMFRWLSNTRLVLDIADGLKAGLTGVTNVLFNSSDTFEYIGLRLQGFSSELSHLTINSREGAAAAREMAQAEIEATEQAAKHAAQMKASAEAARIETIEKKNTEALLKLEKDLRRAATEATQKQTEAVRNIAEAMKTNDQIMKGLSDETIRAVKTALEHGAALKDVAEAYDLTDRQAKILGDTFTEQKKAMDDVNAAWKELSQAGQSTQDALRGVSSVIIAQVSDFIQAGASLGTLKTAYGLTDAQIQAIQETLRVGESAWAREQSGIANTAAQVRTLAGEWTTAAEAKERAQTGGAFEINRANLAQNLRTFGIPEDAGLAMAERGFSFQEIIAAWRSGNVAQWKPTGPRIPGFREGGVGDFGDGTLAMLHGREAIVPLDGPGIGNTVNNFYVNGTAEEVARKIENIIMQKARRGRQFGAA